MLARLDLASSKYYVWLKRRDSENCHNAKTPKNGWLLPDEKRAIIGFYDQNLSEGYRRLAYMMNDQWVGGRQPIQRPSSPARSRTNQNQRRAQVQEMQWLRATDQALSGVAHRHLVYLNRWRFLLDLHLSGWLITSRRAFGTSRNNDRARD